MQYIFVSVPGNKDTCERESENQQQCFMLYCQESLTS